MATSLAARWAVVAFALLLLVACRAPWSSAKRSTATAVTPEATATPATTASAPEPRATPFPSTPAATPAAISTVAPATPGHAATPAASPPAAPTVTTGQIASCCGTFAFVDASALLVYDAPPGKQAGSWLVNIHSGIRRYLAPHFGAPSAAGVVAVSRPDVGRTDILRLDGTVVATLENAGTTTWISPDGSRVAWLAREPQRTPSSLLARPVQLWTAGVDGSGAHAVAELLASDLAWLPDNRRVILLGRRLDGSSPGVWTIDVTTGAVVVLAEAPFPQALHLAPDGQSFAFLSTFTGHAEQDGEWAVSIDGSRRVHLPGVGGVRWAPDSRSLWQRQAGEGSDPDSLVELDVASGREMRRVRLAAQVRTDMWEVSPGGDAVVYWRDADGAVVIEPLSP